MKHIKLGILDQSVVRQGATVQEAIQETISTAKLAEDLGYSRFWISEHHNSTFIAGSTPEVLMVKLADATNHIRIGSGGIMLPNHSALKVAENFRMLETLFPGRIDLGMGRAPGTDRITSSLLNPSNDFSESSYLRQLEHLQHFFRDTAGTERGFIYAAPQSTTIPMQWILSSSGGSSNIAARFGMGLAVAKFINGFVKPDVIETYRKNFRPSDQYAQPHALLSVFVLCGETEEKALEMRKMMDYILVEFEKGKFGPFPDADTVRKYRFTEGELERIRYNSGRIVSGTKEDVKEQLTRLADDFDVDEIIISTMADSNESRVRSFELISEAFNLREPVQ
ncbi:LLM class flavin-dependent oxidoreductase [Dyadobacter chenwenxiniae]|uniref:LLM class flavin-dependent oxidoreductase n=1 Tax=Dyadobacter chenwenxiniae TaxID=2906456 RepID=A0A9X1TFJ1_9BACT|nr:LLM class flavin-dependent oxidoreductase [Dyadobacter chenwenxiniae]MCF0050826.1 LLM class flavin-dependent oxidoreductase [Dyadobacter chenwenxiniae]MCF0063012.1 LLM class flavin-dependent oxidoreductase [Dyadobacter chenwenxiniae]UON84815.1 LLM class flavin-dependent oxidoreductase [Dyadobacter chenwenxiniae]